MEVDLAILVSVAVSRTAILSCLRIIIMMLRFAGISIIAT